MTEDSCISPIFFIFSSMSIFCSSFLISDLRRRSVSSLWWCLATAAEQAEWMAVIQFSSSVWLVVCGGGGRGNRHLLGYRSGTSQRASPKWSSS